MPQSHLEGIRKKSQVEREGGREGGRDLGEKVDRWEVVGGGGLIWYWVMEKG